jgi:hypothetical protein
MIMLLLISDDGDVSECAVSQSPHVHGSPDEWLWQRGGRHVHRRVRRHVRRVLREPQHRQRVRPLRARHGHEGVGRAEQRDRARELREREGE